MVILPCESCGEDMMFHIEQLSSEEVEFTEEAICECGKAATLTQYDKAIDKFWDSLEDERLYGGDPYGGDGEDD